MPDTNDIDEVDAMKQVGIALKGLDPEAIRRVLNWANDRFGQRAAKPALLREVAEAQAEQREGGLPAELADAYAAAHPETEAERALVVACWIQHVRGDSDFDAQSVNKELKHLGDGVGNITQAFTQLIEQKPQLVIQTRKKGTSRQARKLFKVTAAGLRTVRELIASRGGE